MTSRMANTTHSNRNENVTTAIGGQMKVAITRTNNMPILYHAYA